METKTFEFVHTEPSTVSDLNETIAQLMGCMSNIRGFMYLWLEGQLRPSKAAEGFENYK